VKARSTGSHRTLLDVDLLQDADELGKHITGLIHVATRRTQSFFPVPYSWRTPGNIRAWRSVERLNRTVYAMIQRRRECGRDNGDLLSMLLLSSDEENGALSNEQVRDEAMTLFLVGHETTANAATWTLYLLAHHPDIQRQFQEQVRRTIGDRLIQYEDLARIPLLLQVFKESMRLFPPAFIVIREPVRKLTLRGGIAVKPGEIVAMCEYLLHRKPEYFPDPLKFDPSRFTPENEAKIPRYAYFPFGVGRRICIENQFALMRARSSWRR
jgi:cytochrome P450